MQKDVTNKTLCNHKKREQVSLMLKNPDFPFNIMYPYVRMTSSIWVKVYLKFHLIDAAEEQRALNLELVVSGHLQLIQNSTPSVAWRRQCEIPIIQVLCF
jgi:hypothetical protein